MQDLEEPESSRDDSKTTGRLSGSPLKKAWELEEVSWGAFSERKVPPDLLHVVSTTALVESRADMYAEYLLSVFHYRPEWHAKIHLWNSEERQHGQALRKWCERAIPKFDFKADYARYLSKVEYHERDGRSVRGSIRDELISRCTVEALASGYYAALHDATDEPLLRDICARLRQDEARHFSMFYSFLRDAGGVDARYFLRASEVCLRRMLELDDDQIIYAAFCVGTYQNWKLARRRVRADYFSQLLCAYRWRHAYYITGMLLKIFDLKAGSILHRIATIGMCLMIFIKLNRSRIDRRIFA